MNRYSIFAGITACCVSLFGNTAPAETEVVVAKAVTIQPSGPRQGEAGKNYFNVEGKENEKYASFGVLVFELPKDVEGKELKGLTLSLVQTAPRFAKDGAIKFFLAPNFDSKTELKFNVNTPDGVGKQIEPLQALASGDFKNPEKGKTQSFKLSVNDAVRDRVAQGASSAWWSFPPTRRLPRRTSALTKRPQRTLRSSRWICLDSVRSKEFFRSCGAKP